MKLQNKRRGLGSLTFLQKASTKTRLWNGLRRTWTSPWKHPKMIRAGSECLKKWGSAWEKGWQGEAWEVRRVRVRKIGFFFFFLTLVFKVKECVKRKKGPILPFYSTTSENSPTVWLKPLCDQRSRLFKDFYGWDEKTFQNLESTTTIRGTEVSHASGEKHAVTCTNYVITFRTCLPKHDTCPMDTKQHLLNRFPEKLKRYASVNHSWSYITLDLIRLALSEVDQNSPCQWPKRISYLGLHSPRASIRLGANCCTVSWRGIKALWRGKRGVRCGEQASSQHTTREL